MEGEVYGGGLGSGEAEDHDLVGVAAEVLAVVSDAIESVVHGGEGAGQIEFAAVIDDGGGIGGCVEVDEDVAEGLVCAEISRVAIEVALDERGGGGGLAGGEVGLDGFDLVGAAGEVAGEVGGSAGPEGVFVELDVFLGDGAEDHGADAAVADGEGFGHPGFGGVGVGEGEVVGAGDR